MDGMDELIKLFLGPKPHHKVKSQSRKNTNTKAQKIKAQMGHK